MARGRYMLVDMHYHNHCTPSSLGTGKRETVTIGKCQGAKDCPVCIYIGWAVRYAAKLVKFWIILWHTVHSSAILFMCRNHIRGHDLDINVIS